jgi:hypothetical protein
MLERLFRATITASFGVHVSDWAVQNPGESIPFSGMMLLTLHCQFMEGAAPASVTDGARKAHSHFQILSLSLQIVLCISGGGRYLAWHCT